MMIIMIVFAMVYFALNNSNDTQAVDNAALEFVANLRSIQNQVANGANGVNNEFLLFGSGGTSYQSFDNAARLLSTVTLPNGVSMCTTPNYSGGMAVCAANPNMSTYSGVYTKSWCWVCNPGSYFACNSHDWAAQYAVVGAGTNTLTVTFIKGACGGSGYSRTVTISGQGTVINSISSQ